MQTKLFSYALGALLLVGVGAATKFYVDYKQAQKALDEKEKELAACKSVPDFTPALFNVQEFIGARRRMHFKVECRNTRNVEDFYNEKCEIQVEEEITNPIELKEYYDGTFMGSGYVVDWLEDWNFYIDLSEASNKWETNHDSKTIVFNAAPIRVSRLSRENILPYTRDLSVWKNDKKQLLNMVLLTDGFGAQKAKIYLEQHYAEIREDMKRSIQEFLQKVNAKLGYSEYTIEVFFEPLPTVVGS